jgi:hypothetical protein
MRTLLFTFALALFFSGCTQLDQNDQPKTSTVHPVQGPPANCIVLRQFDTNMLIDNAGGAWADLLHFNFTRSNSSPACSASIVYFNVVIEYNLVLQESPPKYVRLCINGVCTTIQDGAQPGFEQSWNSIWHAWGDPLLSQGFVPPMDVVVQCNNCGPTGSILRTTMEVAAWADPNGGPNFIYRTTDGMVRVSSAAIIVE